MRAIIASKARAFADYSGDEPGIPSLYKNLGDWTTQGTLLSDADAGFLRFHVNDTYYPDNVPDAGSPMSFKVALMHGRSFFKDLAMKLRKP